MIDSSLRPASLFSLTGRVAIVTGASSGMGLASAEALAAAGAHVVLAGLGDAATVARDLTDRGMSAIGVECDVTAPSAAAALVAEAMDRFRRIDVVFANAGAAMDAPEDAARPGAEAALDRLDRMVDLHLRSVLRLADAALPVMADGGGGLFLVMSSLSGLRGNRAIAGYGITKAANAQLARNIAVQWGAKGIRSNALSPGVIATDFARPITDDPEAARTRLTKTPLGRFGRPEEVAGAVVWLASDAGAFVSGQNIVIDGGTLASD
jgi:NAD(P)-dependent dehydrogenase (short-subunit alcohol dehydrogenase family)